MGRGPRPDADGAGRSFRSLVRSLGAWGSRKAGAASARARIAVGRPGRTARRVAIKAHVVRLTPSGMKAAALHLRYIQRDGVEADGSKGTLYDAAGPAPAEASERPCPDERHQFRIIVSPEDGAELDLTLYVRRLMAQVERDLGQRLEWAAVNHYNTGHPHAHLVVRGVDRDGREVRLPRAYISHGMRWRAQQIATEELGPRPEHEIRRAHEKEAAQERYTSLDRELERRMEAGEVTVHPGRRSSGRIDETLLLGRLDRLERMGLAQRLSPQRWSMASGWTATLRAFGMRGDILKEMHAAVSGDPSRYHVVRLGEGIPDGYGGTQPGWLVGRLVAKGLADELKGSFYAVVETPDGAAYHLPVAPQTASELRTGALVSFAARPEPPVRPIDRHILETAMGAGGAYIARPVADSEAAHADRRLRQLASMGLVTPIAPGRWSVPADLLVRIEQEAQRQPARYRVTVRAQPLSLDAQVPYAGPVWLDRVHAQGLAPYGFGVEVARACEARRQALRDLGIDPDDPSRLAKLYDLERAAVARRFAVQARQQFLPDPPADFRGRPSGTVTTPAGLRYSVLSDGARFAVIPERQDPRRRGPQATVTRDAKQDPPVRAPDDRDLE